MKKVVKFGGSSLASAEQFKKVGNIIRAEESRRYVIPSAPGKRFSDDVKVTDMLYKCYGAAVKGKKFTDLLKDIQERYNEIIEGLGLTLSLEKEFEIIRDNFAKKAGRDYAASRGEYLNGIIMANYLGYEFIDAAEEVDADLKAVTESTPKAVEDKMEELRVADAMTEIFNLFKRCNKYIDETMPWVLAKDEAKKDRLETVLWNLIQSISRGAELLESFMPSTSKKILEQLGNGHVTEKPEILFARLDLEEVLKKVEELHPPVEEEKEEEDVIDIEAKPEITFDDFGKMQFQVGEIIACEEVKKSRKLLCSQVKIGSQVKQIVSGIKGHYTAEEMVGKKVMVLVNLKPAKLAGVLSEGMLLCAEDAEGNLALMTPEKSMPAGAEIC